MCRTQVLVVFEQQCSSCNPRLQSHFIVDNSKYFPTLNSNISLKLFWIGKTKESDKATCVSKLQSSQLFNGRVWIRKFEISKLVYSPKWTGLIFFGKHCSLLARLLMQWFNYTEAVTSLNINGTLSSQPTGLHFIPRSTTLKDYFTVKPNTVYSTIDRATF